MKYIERKDYNKVITVKLVILGGCNAKCPFCYNKDKDMLCDKQQFLDNFIESLDNIITRIGDKNPISVDITGGEPTLDPEYLSKVFIKLKEFNIKSKVLRVTMATNGTHLKEVIPYMKDVVDYVNISIHDWRPIRREEISVSLGGEVLEKLWEKVEDKLNKSGRKWAETDYMPYRCAELFCEKCGKSMGVQDIVYTDLRTLMYCNDCVQPYVRQVPYNLTDDKEIVFDNGLTVEIKYKDNYYHDLTCDKICYFNKKGRYIKIKGKTYYLNINNELQL